MKAGIRLRSRQLVKPSQALPACAQWPEETIKAPSARLNFAESHRIASVDSLGAFDDDRFAYSPGAMESTGDYRVVRACDSVTIPGDAAGDEYINVGSTFSFVGSYETAETPEPCMR